MSGFNPYGNPQYPAPQAQIYPQLYNPANAPAPGSYPGMPQPGFAYPGQPGVAQQPGHPAAMSYPNVTPSAPPPAGFGYPSAVPGYGATPGYPGVNVSAYPTMSPTSVAKVEWIPSTPEMARSLSDRAIVAGYEGHDKSPLWVIRARWEGDLIPGKLAINHNAAYVAWGGNENSVRNFEVCCARPETVRWVESSNGNVPPNAVPGGHTSSGETLFIGRAKREGSLTPGKVHPSHKVMYSRQLIKCNSISMHNSIYVKLLERTNTCL